MMATVDRTKMARNDLTVKIDADLVTKAKHIVIDRGTTLAEYLSVILRPTIERDYKDVVAKLAAESSTTKKSTKPGRGE